MELYMYWRAWSCKINAIIRRNKEQINTKCRHEVEKQISECCPRRHPVYVPFEGAMANFLHVLRLLPHPKGGMRRADEAEALDGHLVAAVDLEMIVSVTEGALAHLLADEVEVGLDPRRLVVRRQLNVEGTKDELSLRLVGLDELAEFLVAANLGAILVRTIFDGWALVCHLYGGAGQGGGGEECGYGQCHRQKR